MGGAIIFRTIFAMISALVRSCTADDGKDYGKDEGGGSVAWRVSGNRGNRMNRGIRANRFCRFVRFVSMPFCGMAAPDRPCTACRARGPDLLLAGADYQDADIEAGVVDGKLVTGPCAFTLRGPRDRPGRRRSDPGRAEHAQDLRTKRAATGFLKFQGGTVKALFALTVSARCPLIPPHGQSGSKRPSRFGRATRHRSGEYLCKTA